MAHSRREDTGGSYEGRAGSRSRTAGSAIAHVCYTGRDQRREARAHVPAHARNYTHRGMATTQTSRPAIGTLNRTGPMADRAVFSGLVAVLLFSVLTIWTYDRWAFAVTQVGIFTLGLIAAFRSTILGGGWPRSWLQLPFFTAIGWGVMQLWAHQSVYRFQTWCAILDWTTLAFAFVIAVQIFQRERLRRNFLVFAAYFGGVLAL